MRSLSVANRPAVSSIEERFCSSQSTGNYPEPHRIVNIASGRSGCAIKQSRRGPKAILLDLERHKIRLFGRQLIAKHNSYGIIASFSMHLKLIILHSMMGFLIDSERWWAGGSEMSAQNNS